MTALKPLAISRTTVTESAVLYLRDQILAAALQPGEALPEARVGEMLGVSRAPVREALTLLEREGLIVFDRRGTARVSQFGPEDVQELGRMRQALEPVAARLACSRLAAESTEAFQENLRQLRAARTLADVTRLDIAFHRLILTTSGNRRLLVAWDQFAGQFHVVMTLFHQQIEARTRTTRETTHRSHSELFESLSASDPDQAESLARRPAESWLQDLQAFESRPPATPSTPQQNTSREACP